MKDFPALSYTSFSKIPTLLYNRKPEKVPPTPLRVYNLVHKNWTVQTNYPQKGNAFIEMNATFDIHIKVCKKR